MLPCRLGWHLTLQNEPTNRKHQAVITAMAAQLLPVNKIRRELDQVDAIQVSGQTPQVMSQCIRLLDIGAELTGLHQSRERAADNLIPGFIGAVSLKLTGGLAVFECAMFQAFLEI